MQITWQENHDRYYDLLELNGVINDESQPKFRRQQAARSKASIIRQLSDRKLQSLRERLVKAVTAGDQPEQAKISAQIKDHMHEAKIEDK